MKKTTAIIKQRSDGQKQQAVIADIRRIFTHLRTARKDMKKQSGIIQKFYSNVRTSKYLYLSYRYFKFSNLPIEDLAIDNP